MNCPYPFKLPKEKVSPAHYLMNRGLVPCGQCAVCRQARINDWKFRLEWEAKDPKVISTAFITLTYADEYLSYVNSETGEITKMAQLVPDDLTKFIKNLRRQQEYHYTKQLKIRYFAIGEYGTKLSRPHYHLIIYNLHPDYLKVDATHGKMRVNYKLTKIWKKGYTDVGTLTPKSINYVAEFHSLPSNRFEGSGRIPEFSRMSTRPILGEWYVKKNMETHWKAEKYFVNSGKAKQRLPRTIKNKVFHCPLIKNNAQVKAAMQAQDKYLEELQYIEDQNPNLDPQEQYENNKRSKERSIRKRRKARGKL